MNKKLAHPLLIVALLVFLFYVQLEIQKNDYVKQCDGKTKLYASLGKTYACDNYQQPQINGELQ